MEPFSFATSDQLEYPVSIRIINLEGAEAPLPFTYLEEHPELRFIGSNLSPHSDLYVTVQVWAGSKPLTVPVQTAYKSFRAERRWNEWLTLPVTYSTLPQNSRLAITIWDLSPTGGPDAQGHAIPFGGTTLPLFDKDNQLHKGRQKCRVYRHRLADGNDDCTTPAILPRKKAKKGSHEDKEADELDRMEKLFKKHEMGEIPRVDWLDQLVFRGFERRGLQSAKSSALQEARLQKGTQAEALKGARDPSAPPDPSSFLLNVELPRFDFPVVFADHQYQAPPVSSMLHLSSSQSNIIPKPPPEVQFGPGINAMDDDEGYGGRLIRVYDPEVAAKDNPAESKHRRLVRSQHRNGILDKDLKPNAKVRDELNLIMSYSPTHILSPEEKDLIWKFRHHLTRNKKALTKFAKSVNWQDQSESRQAVQILGKWTDIDVDDALELLGPTFDNAALRAFAVERLRKADDNELLLYLLQLVQALKYEHISPQSDHEVTQDSSLARFLISRAANSFTLGNYFWWYVMVECDDKSQDQGQDNQAIYGKIAYDFMTELVKQPDGVATRKTLLRQGEWICILSKISGEIKESNESIARRTERVKHFLADPKNELVTIEPPLPLPLDPSVEITGVVPEETVVFKSSLHPIKVAFKTTTGRKYPIIFKTGDDLRQDQLVIQIITLMDDLLQKENLDLKLSPYKILATSTSAGLSQFVHSMTFQGISSKYRNNPALAYLKQNNPDSQGPMGLRKETLDTFVKSCAGYCVITYILGVGDRHLDNLLLAPDGHFFHADFGYILGRDPKPFAPAMKLSKEMVDCMGGSNSEHYRQFKQYCFLAYSALRKNSNLILNLFSLMVDANIPDIKLEPDKAALKVKERFHLELSEEEAIRHLERIMDDNLNALVPVVIDKLHELVQAFRA
ncbi:Phosphatidylinositol 3-kinase catalytic subunit type 3 [Madurella mycetomatis]|uniref:Phosphatidylinositol 3-kinase VPS34 n=1 Tax=Madurella mycetomatis TaxID=100816 RepID=A0A175WDA2_9PEZI|nr:Phosphatidylinositol 3-kinase catalytic subunit type 3 [Madurella mycetomatis]